MTFDSSNLIYRNFHVMMNQAWIEKTPESLCDMMMRSFIKEARVTRPNAVFSLWDFGRPSHRDELCATYKESRERSDPILQEAREMLHEILPSFGIVSAGSDRAEADDLSHLIAHTFKMCSGRMISTDYDWLLSLLKNWEVYRPISDDLWTFDRLVEYYGAEKTHEIVLLVKAICGDGSDEVEGLGGFGEATAIQFARKLVANEELGDGVRAQKIRDNMDKIDLNKRIMGMDWILTDEGIRQDLAADVRKVTPRPTQMSMFKHKGTFPKANLDEWKEISEGFNYEFVINHL